MNDASDDDPRWSPDGSPIGFESDRDGGNDIYVMYADGSFSVNVTPNGANDYDLQWSPDGMHVAFLSALLKKRVAEGACNASVRRRARV